MAVLCAIQGYFGGIYRREHTDGKAKSSELGAAALLCTEGEGEI